MATTIDSYADELETYVNGGDRMEPAFGGQKLRRAHFKVTLASQAAGEDIALTTIPEGAVIMGGLVIVSSTLANSAQLSIGLAGKDGSGYVDRANTDADDVAQLKAAGVVTTTAAVAPLVNLIAPTIALGFGYVAEKELWLTATTSVGTVSTETVSGYVDYLIA